MGGAGKQPAYSLWHQCGCTNFKARVRGTLTLEPLIPTWGSLPHHLSIPLPSVPVLPAQALVPSVLSNLVSTKQLEIVSKANLLKNL